jgi:hypothetical protein
MFGLPRKLEIVSGQAAGRIGKDDMAVCFGRLLILVENQGIGSQNFLPKSCTNAFSERGDVFCERCGAGFDDKVPVDLPNRVLS